MSRKYFKVNSYKAYNENFLAFKYVVEQIGAHCGGHSKHLFRFGIESIQAKVRDYKVSKSEIRNMMQSQKYLYSFIPDTDLGANKDVRRADATRAVDRQVYKFTKNGAHILRAIINLMEEIKEKDDSSCEEFMGKVKNGGSDSYWRNLLINDLTDKLESLKSTPSKQETNLDLLIDKLKRLDSKC